VSPRGCGVLSSFRFALTTTPLGTHRFQRAGVGKGVLTGEEGLIRCDPDAQPQRRRVVVSGLGADSDGPFSIAMSLIF
jgi:hypothetical protein